MYVDLVDVMIFVVACLFAGAPLSLALAYIVCGDFKRDWRR